MHEGFHFKHARYTFLRKLFKSIQLIAVQCFPIIFYYEKLKIK